MADLTRKTANLFDKATALANTAISDSNGNTFGSNGLNASDYISVSGMNKLSITNTLSSRWGAFYDTNKVFVSGFNGYGTINVPQNAAYVRITVTDAFLDSCMVNEGETLLPFEPYGWVHSLRKQCSATETIQSGDTIYANGQPISTYSIKGNEKHTGTPSPSNPVILQGTGNKTANLFDKDRTQGIIANAYINQSGQQVSSQNYYLSYPITVTEGEIYTWSFSSDTGTQHTSPTAAFYDNNDTLIGVATHNSAIYHFTFTIPANCAYIRTSVYNGAAATFTPMLIVGTTLIPDNRVMDYIPYGYKIPILNLPSKTNIYTAEPLMKISDSVDSISNTEEIRAIKKYVITGDEIGWSQDGSSGSNNRYRLDISDVKITGTYITDFYNSHYKVETGYAANTSVIWRGTSVTYVYISVPSSDYPTVSDYKTYLQQQYTNGTPVTIWYRMANPTTTQITVPSIPTTDGANTISVDTTVQPSEVSMTWTGWHDSSVQEYQGGVGNQKFDYTQTEGLLLQQYINQEGQAVENTSYNMSYLIPVTPNATYMWNFGSTVQHRAPTAAFYDSNGNYISVATHGSTTAFSFDTPINCAYVRVPIYISAKTAAMLNEGSTALPYEDYQYAWV